VWKPGGVDRVDDGLGGAGLQVAGDDAGSFGPEGEGDGLADPLRGSGDDGGLAGELFHRILRLRREGAAEAALR